MDGHTHAVHALSVEGHHGVSGVAQEHALVQPMIGRALHTKKGACHQNLFVYSYLDGDEGGGFGAEVVAEESLLADQVDCVAKVLFEEMQEAAFVANLVKPMRDAYK